eukprot:2266600-Pyramimonas_sp.AAC.1
MPRQCDRTAHGIAREGTTTGNSGPVRATGALGGANHFAQSRASTGVRSSGRDLATMSAVHARPRQQLGCTQE